MGGVGEKLSRAGAVTQSLGWPTAVLYALALGLRKACPFFCIAKYHVVARPVGKVRLLGNGHTGNLTIRRITQHDPLIAKLGRPADEIDRRFAGKAVCLLALRDDIVVGHLWVTLAPYCEPVHRCAFTPVPAGQVGWEFDFWIAPEERLGLTFARLWDECNGYLNERDVTWACSCISVFNLGAVRAHRRMGMQVLHTLYFLSAGKMELMLANVAPYAALSLRRSPRVLIRPADQISKATNSV